MAKFKTRAFGNVARWAQDYYIGLIFSVALLTVGIIIGKCTC